MWLLDPVISFFIFFKTLCIFYLVAIGPNLAMHSHSLIRRSLCLKGYTLQPFVIECRSMFFIYRKSKLAILHCLHNIYCPEDKVLDQ